MNGNSLMFGVSSGPYGQGNMIQVPRAKFGVPMAVIMKHRCGWTAMILNGDQI